MGFNLSEFTIPKPRVSPQRQAAMDMIADTLHKARPRNDYGAISGDEGHGAWMQYVATVGAFADRLAAADRAFDRRRFIQGCGAIGYVV